MHYKLLLSQNLSFLISEVLQHLIQTYHLENGVILNDSIWEGFSTAKGTVHDSRRGRRQGKKKNQAKEEAEWQNNTTVRWKKGSENMSKEMK